MKKFGIVLTLLAVIGLGGCTSNGFGGMDARTVITELDIAGCDIKSFETSDRTESTKVTCFDHD